LRRGDPPLVEPPAERRIPLVPAPHDRGRHRRKPTHAPRPRAPGRKAPEEPSPPRTRVVDQQHTVNDLERVAPGGGAAGGSGEGRPVTSGRPVLGGRLRGYAAVKS